jgi:excinuclease UvrABC nuclease subunit
LVELAAENAALYLHQERARAVGPAGVALRELQEALRLDTVPFRVEAYDISNFQAGEAVGSLITFEGGRPKKSDYRRFKMKWTEGPNDYAMLQEMLRRRFAQARDEQDVQIENLLRQILTPEARERLGRLKVARPEEARALEGQLVQLAQSGRLQNRVDDEQLKLILARLFPGNRDISIKRK